MREIMLRQLQLKELEILQEVDRICRANNIKYYLTWGTALGAVRHGGFIPWDDDIDISMFWDDYLRFEEVCKTELKKNFFFQTRKTDSYHYQPYNKIRMNNTTSMPRDLSYINMHWGICIDIFPIIDIPESRFAMRIQRFNVMIYLRICQVRYHKIKKQINNNIVKRTMLKIIKLIPMKVYDFFENILIKQIVKYKDSSLCGEILDQKYNEAIMEKAIFGEGYGINFEGTKYLIPQKYEFYLSQLYGNYLELPKEEDRGGHGDIIIDINKDYKHYLIK